MKKGMSLILAGLVVLGLYVGIKAAGHAGYVAGCEKGTATLARYLDLKVTDPEQLHKACEQMYEGKL